LKWVIALFVLAGCAPVDDAADSAGGTSVEDAGRVADAVSSTGDAAALAPGCLAAIVGVETEAAGEVEVFAYEASRADDGGARACSRAGATPWTDVTLAGARAACAASGFELCDGPTWQRICAGAAGRAFPYGPVHRPGVCNDHVSGSSALELTGNRPECVTPEGVFDLSGNVWELTVAGGDGGGERRGASFRVNAVTFRSDAARCDQPYVVAEDYATDDLGFRCCR